MFVKLMGHTFLAQAACVRHACLRAPCVAWPLLSPSFSLSSFSPLSLLFLSSFFFSVFCFWPISGKLPCAKYFLQSLEYSLEGSSGLQQIKLVSFFLDVLCIRHGKKKSTFNVFEKLHFGSHSTNLTCTKQIFKLRLVRSSQMQVQIIKGTPHVKKNRCEREACISHLQYLKKIFWL